MRLVAIYCLLLLLLSCSQIQKKEEQQKATKSLVISGKVVNAPNDNSSIIYELPAAGRPIPLDTIKPDDQGNYKIELKEAGFYQLNFFGQASSVLAVEKPFQVNYDGDQANPISISGSTSADFQQKMYDIQFELNKEVMDFRSQLTEQVTNVDSLIQVEKKIRADFQNQMKELIKGAEVNLAFLIAMSQFELDGNTTFLMENAKKLSKKYPENLHIKGYTDNLKKSSLLAVGSPAPEIRLPNPKGDSVSLSSLQGKYVLLDFWAAWCGPCRRENPNVVRLYNKYNEKGFEVFSVSLDRRKQDWINAIAKDGLNWTHVSDLAYFKSIAAQTYNIQSIPSTFLLDKEGKILAKGLRGKALEEKLRDIFE